jgi:hypothetical protein
MFVGRGDAGDGLDARKALLLVARPRQIENAILLSSRCLLTTSSLAGWLSG